MQANHFSVPLSYRLYLFGRNLVLFLELRKQKAPKGDNLNINLCILHPMRTDFEFLSKCRVESIDLDKKTSVFVQMYG